MSADTKIILTVITCITVIVTGICVGAINSQNRIAEVRKAEIEAGCKVEGGGEVRVLR